MNSIRLQRGTDIINTLTPKGADKLLAGMKEIAPDLSNLVLEHVFGDIYAREGLDIKTKQIITLTSLATIGFAKPQLYYHIKAALRLGLSKEDIISIFIHLSAYAGFPATLNAVATAREVFEEIEKPTRE